jgi:hypothetical protein
VVFRAGALEGMVTPSTSFWQGRRVLITGHTGFKGSWLWQWLRMLGAEVAGFALPPDTEPNLFQLAGLQDHVQSRFGDIRERAKLQALMSEADPEIVFHMAAQSLVQRSYREPVATFETNVLGTAYVLDAIHRAASVRCALIVTSDKCYQPPDAGFVSGNRFRQSRQCSRRRRLGARPAHSGLHTCFSTWQHCRNSEPGRGPSLAAYSGCIVGLLDTGGTAASRSG